MSIQPGKYELNVNQKQMLPEPLSSDAKKARAEADEEAEQFKRLDEVAKVLLTATTITFALLTALGVSGDRFPALLNSSTAKLLVVLAVLCALGAAFCGFTALAETTNVGKEKGWVGTGIVALFASLGLALWSSSVAFTEDGRPTMGEVSVETKSDDVLAKVTFTVLSDGVSRDSCMRVTAFWTGKSSSPTEDLLYVSSLRPDTKGVVNQKVTMTLGRPREDRRLRIQVTRGDEEGTGCQPAKLVTPQPAPSGTASPSDSASSPPPVVFMFPGASCLDQSDQKTAPVCTDILVPAIEAKRTSTPTPTPAPSP